MWLVTLLNVVCCKCVSSSVAVSQVGEELCSGRKRLAFSLMILDHIYLPQFPSQLSAPVVGVWQHEGGWLQEVLLSSQSVNEVSSGDHTPQLMLVQYNSQYYLQLAASPQRQRGLQLHNSLGKPPKVEGSCVESLNEMREVCSSASKSSKTLQ